MDNRRVILFKIKNEVVVEELKDLTIVDVEKMKWVIAEECECQYDDIDVEYVELPNDLSEIDVSVDGMYDWKDGDYKILTGVSLTIDKGSDEYLDALNSGTVDKYIEFI